MQIKGIMQYAMYCIFLQIAWRYLSFKPRTFFFFKTHNRRIIRHTTVRLSAHLSTNHSTAMRISIAGAVLWLVERMSRRSTFPLFDCTTVQIKENRCPKLNSMFIFLRQLLPVRIVIAPSPQHHLALLQYQEVFPEAFYICGKASGQMPPLTRHSDQKKKI